jgi:hypothetical protein
MVEPPDIKIKRIQKPIAEEKVEEKVTAESDDFSCWLSPQILKNADACRLLDRFADSCCPEVQLYIVRRWMQNANRVILSRANEDFFKSGGLGQVLRDLKKAERVILNVYGLEDE